MEIYVSGCTRNCVGCHGEELKDYNTGTPLDLDALNCYLNARKDLFKAISVLGGDLLCQKQEDAFKLVLMLKKHYPDKELWLFTGESDFNNIPDSYKAIFDYIKYGDYREDLKQEGFPASSNQKLWSKHAGTDTNYPRQDKQ